MSPLPPPRGPTCGRGDCAQRWVLSRWGPAPDTLLVPLQPACPSALPGLATVTRPPHPCSNQLPLQRSPWEPWKRTGPAVPAAPGRGGPGGGRTEPSTHGPRPSLHSKPRWHPGHEVLLPGVPQQHNVLGRPHPLCLLLPRQPVQPQRGRGPGGQPRGSVAQCLRQPAVGAAPGGLLSPRSTGGPPALTRPLAGRRQPAPLPALGHAGGKSPCLSCAPPCFPRGRRPPPRAPTPGREAPLPQGTRL